MLKEEFPQDTLSMFYNIHCTSESNNNNNANWVSSLQKSSNSLQNYQTNRGVLSNKQGFMPPANNVKYNKDFYNKSQILSHKRKHEEMCDKQSSNSEHNHDEDYHNNNTVQKINITTINSENLDNLKNILPNFLSQNVGVINWVVPGEVLKNNVNTNEEKSDKL